MSHNVETMAYAGELPWHGLGVPVSNDMSAYEMMEAAQLNWTVKKVPLYREFQGNLKGSWKDYTKEYRPNHKRNQRLLDSEQDASSYLQHLAQYYLLLLLVPSYYLLVDTL